jgi:hypothetical protein
MALEQGPSRVVGSVQIHALGRIGRAGYSDFFRLYPINDYWALSLAEAPIEGWRTAQWPLFLLIGGAALLGLRSLRHCDVRFVAPALCVAAQLGMHGVYGKEPIIYSPNFHGAFAALVISASWTGFPLVRARVASIWLLLAVAALANNLSVLDRVYRELDYGLDGVLRAADGAPLDAF